MRDQRPFRDQTKWYRWIMSGFCTMLHGRYFIAGLFRYQNGCWRYKDYLVTPKTLEKNEKAILNLPEPPNFMYSFKPITVQDQRMFWDRTEWYRFGVVIILSSLAFVLDWVLLTSRYSYYVCALNTI